MIARCQSPLGYLPYFRFRMLRLITSKGQSRSSALSLERIVLDLVASRHLSTKLFEISLSALGLSSWNPVTTLGLFESSVGNVKLTCQVLRRNQFFRPFTWTKFTCAPIKPSDGRSTLSGMSHSGGSFCGIMCSAEYRLVRVFLLG